VEIKRKNIIPLGVTIGGYTFDTPTLKWDITTVDGVLNLVTVIFNILVGLSALVAVGMIIYSGYMFITSSGDPDKVAKGGSALTAAIIGMVIVFLARTIILFILDRILV
jgi:membrane protein DedA with SNARE-associated domain